MEFESGGRDKSDILDRDNSRRKNGEGNLGGGVRRRR